jgi:hypothetical protein
MKRQRSLDQSGRWVVAVAPAMSPVEELKNCRKLASRILECHYGGSVVRGQECSNRLIQESADRG